MAKLTVKQVVALKTRGTYGDGDGLYLKVGTGGAKSWILRTVVQGTRRDFGLGSIKLVTLAEAREKARELRKIAREGKDPRQRRTKKGISFEEAARRTHRRLSNSWTSERHGQIWLSSLERFVFPAIGNRPISEIRTHDLFTLLDPLWEDKFETANRLRQRISAVFDWARGAGMFEDANPASGLNTALGNSRPTVRHMPSMTWKELPAFVASLAERNSVSARALVFLILTAARSGEVRGATWWEIEGTTWNIPASRMKARKEHMVPLTPAAIAQLDAVRGLDQDLVFPSPSRRGSRTNTQLSDVAFKALMQRMGVHGVTTHGFRTTFRIWCSEAANVDTDVAESALAHSLGSKVSRAYNRTTLFDKRVQLMTRWSQFALSKTSIPR